MAVSARTSKMLSGRLFFVFVIFMILGLGVISRLFYLQIMQYREFSEIASRQAQNGELATPRRGAIYFQDKDGNLQAAALNKNLYTLSAVPKEIQDPVIAAQELAPILTLDEESIREKLSRPNDTYEIITRKVDDEAVLKIRPLGLKGIYLEIESRRIYPGDDLASHVLGFVKFDNDKESGQYGIERYFQRELAGEDGFWEGVDNSLSSIWMVSKRIINPPKDGKSIVLTVDYNIQRKAEEKLKFLIEKWRPENGSITIVDPITGKILALAASPGFNPNNYGKTASVGIFLNHVVESTYEMGSVMKPITMASAINENAVKPDTTYEDSGEVRIKGYTIKNYDLKAHGSQTMTGVLEKSLNTGAVFAQQKLGNDKFLEYIKRFGFGEKTGIKLPGEVLGNISNLKTGRDIEFATASFGQGIAVSPLQMIMAESAIANGGNLMRPYIVEKIVDDSGAEQSFGPEVRRQVISKETSEALSKMLVSVTRQGFENRAGVKGFFVASKTGTAQVPNTNGRGYSADVIHSFMGYAPAFNPKFLIFMQMNRPKGVNFASTSLSPTFHDLAEYILNYYEIPPDEK